MTAAEMGKLIGQGYVHFDGSLAFYTVIIDARITYGRVHVKIRPECGSGDRWVEFSNVKRIERPENMLKAVERRF